MKILRRLFRPFLRTLGVRKPRRPTVIVRFPPYALR